MLDLADQAVFHAKAEGRNRIVALPVMDGLEAIRLPPQTAGEAGIDPSATRPATSASSTSTTAATGDPQMAGLLASLHDLPGVAPEQAIGMLCLSPARYVELLRLFMEQHHDDGAQLSVALAQGQVDQARLVAHNLKGVTGSLGLNRLCLLATTLNDLLRSAAPEPTQANALVGQIGTHLNRLSAVFAQFPPPPPPVKHLDAAARRQLLAAIRQLLVNSDTMARVTCVEHEQFLRSQLGKDYPAFAVAVGNFDFDAALALLAPHSEVGNDLRSD